MSVTAERLAGVPFPFPSATEHDSDESRSQSYRKIARGKEGEVLEGEERAGNITQLVGCLSITHAVQILALHLKKKGGDTCL